MATKLKWAAASGMWLGALLALLAALPSEARAADPVPSECQNANLSPAAKARCDFIARTPDLCQRSGLSQATQQFCDQLAGAPALPEESNSPDNQRQIGEFGPARWARV